MSPSYRLPAPVRSGLMTYAPGRKHPQLVVGEIATAVWGVQMNTVTFHPWPVRATDAEGALDRPDEVRIDLDPQPGCGFREAVEAARLASRPGDAVLLSPACASYGLFRNFEERGRTFKQLVSEFAADAGKAGE